MLRAPLLAARLVVVPNPATADALRDQYPEARVRFAPLGVGSDPGDGATQPIESPRHRGLTPTRFGILGSGRLETVERALQRARESGASAELMAGASPE